MVQDKDAPSDDIRLNKDSVNALGDGSGLNLDNTDAFCDEIALKVNNTDALSDCIGLEAMDTNTPSNDIRMFVDKADTLCNDIKLTVDNRDTPSGDIELLVDKADAPCGDDIGLFVDKADAPSDDDIGLFVDKANVPSADTELNVEITNHASTVGVDDRNGASIIDTVSTENAGVLGSNGLITKELDGDLESEKMFVSSDVRNSFNVVDSSRKYCQSVDSSSLEKFPIFNSTLGGSVSDDGMELSFIVTSSRVEPPFIVSTSGMDHSSIVTDSKVDHSSTVSDCNVVSSIGSDNKVDHSSIVSESRVNHSSIVSESKVAHFLIETGSRVDHSSIVSSNRRDEHEKNSMLEEEEMLTSSILDWPYLEEEVITQDDQEKLPGTLDSGDLKIKLPWSRIFDLEQDEAGAVERQKSLELGPVEVKLHLNSFETSCLKVKRLILQKAHGESSNEEVSANEPIVVLRREDLLEEMIECQVLSVQLGKLVTCDFCGRKLLSEAFLSRHIRHLHELHTCRVCDETFPGELLLLSHTPCHQERHHCLLCNKVFTTANKFKKHEESSNHRQLESVQRQTIHILYKFLSGRDCTLLEPLTEEEIARLKWTPDEGDNAVHFYHPTPLHHVLQGNFEIESGPSNACACEKGNCVGNCNEQS